MLELMVVVFILLTVTAISLPLVVPAMSGRQVREGARMLNTFINAARNRAIETGRPAGVWIERLPGLREAAANIYYAEVPPVYSGDYLDSSVELFTVNGVPGASVSSATTFTWESTDNTCKDYWNIVVPRSRTMFNTDIWASPDPLDQQVVREGDLIQIEGSDKRIPLKTVKFASIPGAVSASSNNLWWYIYRGRNCAWNTGPDGAYTSERQMTGEWVIRWFDRNIPVSWSSIRSTTTVPFNPNATGLKYKIFRQPIKLQTGSIKLPDGVVIDLNFSSVTNGNNSDSGMPFHARCDTTNASAVGVPFWGPAIYPQDETPIILVFSPGGHIERLYFRMVEGSLGNVTTAGKQWLWGGMEPFGQIFFLVGKIEKVLPDEYYMLAQDATTNFNKQIKKNWLDLENFWVSVNPQTGFVSTAMVDDISTQGQQVLDAANNRIGGADPNNVWQTRQKARYARISGGN